MVKNGAAVGSAASAVVSQLSWTMQTFGVEFSVLMAGFAGALIALWFMPPTKRWYVALVIGTVTAAYVTPFGVGVLEKYTDLGLVNPRPVAFLIGVSAHFVGTLLFRDGRELFRARLGLEKDDT